ncbi:MAG TPA: lysylphosphatidylglycerol synthase transmembrane domain-containing protein [Alphaproteobacteria bacterium]|nr:lysylphosphatidylglycerol synthase transmembrane domain-containing protein [Alphaproteobacteria bacterium]
MPHTPLANFGKRETIATSLRWVSLAAVLFAGLVFVAGQVVGLKGLDAALGKLSAATVVLLVLAAVASTLIRFLNWPYFCKVQGIAIPLNKLLLYHVAGMALLPTPGKLGTALRLWLMHKHHKVPYRRSAPILLFDLLTDFLALIILVGVALPFLGHVAGLKLAVMLLAGTLGGIIAVLYYPPLPRAVIKLAYRAAGNVKPRFFAGLLRLTVSLRVLVGPQNLLRTLGNAIVGWGIVTLAFALLLNDLGYAHTWPLSIFAIGCGIILGAVSMLPGGLGGTEAIVFSVLLANNVSLADATIFTALMRLCTLWLPVAAGVIVLPFALRKR